MVFAAIAVLFSRSNSNVRLFFLISLFEWYLSAARDKTVLCLGSDRPRCPIRLRHRSSEVEARIMARLCRSSLYFSSLTEYFLDEQI